MKKILVFVCLLLTLCLTTSCFEGFIDNGNGNSGDSDSESVVTIGGDLPINFVVDKDNKIVTINPKSEDSELIIAGEDYAGLTIEEAMEKFFDTAKNCGYEIKNKVEVKLTSLKDSEEAQELLEKLKEKGNQCVEKMNGLKDQCEAKLVDVKSWFNELQENGYELTEEQKADAKEVWNSISSYLNQAKYYSSEKLQQLYDAYKEKEIDKKVQDAYEDIVSKAKDSLSEEKVNEFKEFIQEQKDKYLNNEKEHKTSTEIINSLIEKLNLESEEKEAKKAKLDELETKLKNEIAENTEKYGEETAKVMAGATELLVKAAKAALDGADKLYVLARDAYDKARTKYAEEHDGEELTLKNLVTDVKEKTEKYLEEHPEIKEKITETYDSIKNKVVQGINNFKEKFETEYKAEITDYYQQLIEKKNELIEKYNNPTE